MARRFLPGTWKAAFGLISAALSLGNVGCEGGSIETPGTRGSGGPIATNAGNTAPGVQPAANVPTPSTAAADAMMRTQDPALFDRVMQYFPTEAAANGPARLFRLTRSQIDATTQSLLPMHVTGSVATTMPRDPLQTNYEYAENLSFNDANFTPYVAWIDQVVTSVRAMTAKPVEAFKRITDSLRFQQCFARQLFRFYMGRDEKAGDDPTLRQIFFEFARNDQQDVLAMLRALARAPSFAQRRGSP